jgi:hypothetical protein
MRNKRYNLISTLEKMSEQVIYENLDIDRNVELQRTSAPARAAESSVGIFKKLPALVKFLPSKIGKVAGSLAKSTVMAIPIVDVLVGSAFIASILFRMRSLNDKMAILLNLDGDSFAKFLLAGNNTEYNDLMTKVAGLSEGDRQILREDFESALENIKELILTIVQAYDTVAAAAPAAGAGAMTLGGGAVAVEAGANITTAVLGFLSSVVPIERFFFEQLGTFENAIASVLGVFIKSDDGELGELEEKGGPLAYHVLNQFSKPTLDPENKPSLRLHNFYKLLKKEGETTYLSQAVKGSVASMMPDDQIVSESIDLKRWKKLSGLV